MYNTTSPANEDNRAITATNNIYESSESYYGSKTTTAFNVKTYQQEKPGGNPTETGEIATFSTDSTF